MAALFACLTVLWGLVKQKNVYDAFVRGAREGLRMAARLTAPMLAMLCAAAAMEASGLTGALAGLCAPVLSFFGLPEGAAPLMIMRPLSGSGSLAVLQEIFSACGSDSREGLVAATLCGSSETLLYVLGVYTAGCGVKKTRLVTASALISLAVGALAAGSVWRLMGA